MGHDLDGVVKTGKDGANVFSHLGLNTAEVQAKSLDQQFLDVASAIQKLPPGAERVNAAMEVFGKSGADLIPILAQGRDGLEKVIQKQKDLGLAMSNDDMKKVQEAAAALPRLGALWDGFRRKALVAIAPVLKVVGDGLSKALEWLAPLFEKVGRAMSTHWGIIGDILKEVWSVIEEVAQAVWDWIKSLMPAGQEFKKVEDIIESGWRKIGKGAAYVWDAIKAIGGAFAYVGSYMVKYFGEPFINMVQDLLRMAKRLPDAIRPDWLDGAIAGLDKMKERIPDTAEQMKKWGKGTFDNFGKSVADVDAWFDKRKQQKAGEDFGKAAESHLSKAGENFAKMVEQGSKEDYQLNIAKDLRVELNDQKKQVEIMLANKAINEEMRRLLQRILEESKQGAQIKAVP